jgi:4-hydroxybenzoate polyprenyltransferase
MSQSYRLFFVALIGIVLAGIAVAGPVCAQPATVDPAGVKSALDAQWEMVRWTQNIFWIALAFLGLTLAGVVMIALTLRHTRRAAQAAAAAAGEAEKATRAANDAVDVTRDTAGAQLRA